MLAAFYDNNNSNLQSLQLKTKCYTSTINQGCRNGY